MLAPLLTRLRRQTCFLLLTDPARPLPPQHGELPDATERAEYRSLLRTHRLVHTSLINFYRGAWA